MKLVREKEEDKNVDDVFALFACHGKTFNGKADNPVLSKKKSMTKDANLKCFPNTARPTHSLVPFTSIAYEDIITCSIKKRFQLGDNPFGDPNTEADVWWNSLDVHEGVENFDHTFWITMDNVYLEKE
jgi:hypothetical protein